jgi:hypothetical protein
VINASKTKNVAINRNITNIEQDLIMDRQIFDGVQNFRYLGTLINFKKLISDDIKSRIVACNRCVYSIRRIFSSTAMSKAVEIKI